MKSITNYNDVLSVYEAYPSPIRPFLLHADTNPDIRSVLSKLIRVAFIDLVARTNIADPLRPIKVRVDQTAKRLGISTKTVTRTINLMLENGWLIFHAEHDGRDNNGKYAWREFIVTESLRKLIGLPVIARSSIETDGRYDPDELLDEGQCARGADAPERRSPAPFPAPATKVTCESAADSSGAYSNVRKAIDIAERLASRGTKPSGGAEAAVKVTHNPGPDEPEITDTYPQQPAVQTDLSHGPIYAVNKVFLKKEASFKKGAVVEKPKTQKTPHLPADLKPLQDELGIKPEGICFLMGLAKRTGQRLQDVWNAKRDTLLNSGARGGRAKNYLQCLLNCGEDFSYVARTKIAAQAAAAYSDSTQPETASTPFPAPQDGQDDAGQDKAGRPAGGLAAMIDEVAKACRFKKFRHVSKRLWVRFFDGNAEVSDGINHVVYAGSMQMQGLYFGIVRGNLVEVRE